MNLFVSGLFFSSLAQGVVAGKSKEPGCRLKFSDLITGGKTGFDMEEVLGPCLSDINKPMFSRKMTPLHRAAREGNTWAIDQFLQQGADMDLRDANGLTPLLQAAIQGHEQAVKLLLENKADEALLSKFGGNYADYLRMTAPFRSKEELLSDSLPYSTHTEDNLITDPACFRKGVIFTDENAAKPEVLSSLLEEKSEDYEAVISVLQFVTPRRLQTYFLEKYAEFKQNPPALDISKVEVTDSDQPVQSKMCGLFARNPISKGSIVAEYTGEIKDSLFFTTPTYRVDDYPIIDSIKYRSAASMSNHGFPNTHLIHLAEGNFDEGLDGLPIRKLLVAINDIAEGEEIVWNYGSAYSEPTTKELRDKALKDFIKTVSWEELIESFKRHDSMEISKEEALDILEKTSKFTYFLESPKAIRFAIKNKYLTKEHVNLFKRQLKNDSLCRVCEGLVFNFLAAVEGYFRSNSEL